MRIPDVRLAEPKFLPVSLSWDNFSKVVNAVIPEKGIFKRFWNIGVNSKIIITKNNKTQASDMKRDTDLGNGSINNKLVMWMTDLLKSLVFNLQNHVL